VAHRFSSRLAAAFIAGSILLLMLIIGLGLFVAGSLQDPADTTTKTDAIVALTGGNSRIDTAIGLLNDGMAKKLFISGVNPVTGNRDVKNASHQSIGLFACCITLGYNAVNTIGNADESAQWMQRENYHSLRLVTADYHMKRALLDFRLAMPGVTIIPYPIHPQVSLARHTLLMIEEYAKYLATWPCYALHAATTGP
jgi:uncharacterized SAM-binding protein YcdF (DUF218 family)